MSSTAGGADGDGLSRARAIALAILSVEVVVLIATGIALFFVYRPTANAAWDDLVLARASGGGFANGVRTAHRIASQLAVPTAIAAGVLTAVSWNANLRRWAGGAIGIGIGSTALAASLTGFLLPWDQLAVWSVSVGTNMDGYRPIFRDEVRFALMGGTEVHRETLIRWLIVHMLVLGPALLAAVGLAWRRHVVLGGASRR